MSISHLDQLACRAVLLLTASAAPAVGQVFNPGPDDPTLFTRVLNLPTDPDIDSFEAIGGSDTETIQLNVEDGGRIGDVVDARFGAEVNIYGGIVGDFFDAFNGSEVNLSGGVVGDYFDAKSGSVLSIRGGTVGSHLNAGTGTEVNISAGTVGSWFDAFSGSTVNISGGNVGRDFTAYRSVMNITGGAVGDSFFAEGSEVNLSGGTIGAAFTAAGAQVTITGGSVGAAFDAYSGSVVNLFDGAVGKDFIAHAGSEVSLRGGTVANNFNAFPGSKVELVGGNFHLNGVEYAEPEITLVPGDLFTGVLADGSVFAFNVDTEFSSDSLSGVTLTSVPVPARDTTPRVVSTSITNEPSGLVAGQTLTLQAGGELGENFAVVDAVLNLEGGVLGAGAEIVSSELNIRGGTVGNSLRAISGSEVNLFGSDFRLNGVPIEGLVEGEPFNIEDRNFALTGLLADGTPFVHRIFESDFLDNATVARDATLTVTLVGRVPEPSSARLLLAVAYGLLARRSF